MQKASILVSQILSSSGSSFFSSGSASSSSVMSSNEQIFESFLLFIQSASNEMLNDAQQIEQQCRRLQELIEEMLSNDNSDAYIEGRLEKISEIVSQIYQLIPEKNGLKLCKYDSSLTNQTSSTAEKQYMPEIVAMIRKIVYKLFTGSNKQMYAHIILNMEASPQRIFMELIEKEMSRMERAKDLSMQVSCIEGRNQSFIQCSELTMPVEASVSGTQKEQREAQKKARKSQENKSLPLSELINKVLNLEEQNENLLAELEKYTQRQAGLVKENQQLKNTNKMLKQNERKQNFQISELISQIENLQAEKVKQILKSEKKWQTKLKVVQKNMEEQIAELKQINQALNKKAQMKIAEYEQRLSVKRAKIKRLYESEQKLENSLKEREQTVQNYKDQINYLSQILVQNRQKLNELEILKDSLSMDIDLRNNRLQDMKLLLFSSTNRVGGKQTSMVCHNRECCGTNQFQWSVGSNQWKQSSHASKFQQLNINPHYVNQIGSGSSYSWFRQSSRANQYKNFCSQFPNAAKEDLYNLYEAHVSYLNKKIQQLTQQNQQHLKSLKKFRDLKYENSKLITYLKEHENYRGQQNQIITGCLYQLRKMCKGSFMEGSSLTSINSLKEQKNSHLNVEINQKLNLNSKRN